MALKRVIPTATAAIFLLVLTITLPMGNHVRAAPFVAIVVYDHGLAKGIVYGRHAILVNKTYSFTEDDQAAYAYFTAEVSSANVTWLWYEPNGQLFQNQTTQITCDSSPCTFVYHFPLRNTDAATNFGVWTLTLEVSGSDLYSDHFSITPIINQDNSWRFDIIQSAPARVHGYLTVTIHPHNETWSSYLINMPFAANVTAYDPATNRTLKVSFTNYTFPWPLTGRTIVDLGAPRPDGYTFMIRFDLAYGLREGLGGWNSGYFAFGWQESSLGTFEDGYHPVPGSFEITLPQGASFVDAVGINDIALNQNVTAGVRPTLSIVNTLPPTQRFGWVIIYRDATNPNTNPQPVSNPVGRRLSVAQIQPIPLLPMTVGNFSVWSAVMSVLLLTGSELLSPAYARKGVLINRRRLRIAAVVLVVLFLAGSAYQVIAISQSVPVVGR